MMRKVFGRVLGIALLAVVTVAVLRSAGRGKIGNWIAGCISTYLGVSWETAARLYFNYVRQNLDIFLWVAIVVFFLLFFWSAKQTWNLIFTFCFCPDIKCYRQQEYEAFYYLLHICPDSQYGHTVVKDRHDRGACNHADDAAGASGGRASAYVTGSNGIQLV